MIFLQDVWSDTAGRIFLITFACYLFGYMVYGGYLYAFFSRKGSLPFGLADFSIADLISIFPAAIFTIIDIVPKAFLDFLKGVFLHFGIPLVIGIGIRTATGLRLNLLGLDANWIGPLGIVGLILWLTSYLLSSLRPRKIRWFVYALFEILGAILFFASIPNQGEPLPVIPVPSTQMQQGLNDFLGIILILEAIAVPYAFGVGIARTAIKSELLIKINRLTLRQPIFADGLKKISFAHENRSKHPLHELWLAQKSLPIDIEPEVYEWSPTPEKNTYLIATFEKFVIIYEAKPEAQQNRTIMVNRDMILSIEFANTTQLETPK